MIAAPGRDVSVTASDFKALAGSFMTGVAVITALRETEIQGCTVSSLASASLEPPLILFCLSPHSGTLAAIRTGAPFGLSILSAGQDGRRVARAFAGPGPKSLEAAEAGTFETPRGVPVLRRSLAVAELSIYDEYLAGDHVAVFARVSWTGVYGGSPLAYWRSTFCD